MAEAVAMNSLPSDMEDRVCPGCKLSAVSEGGGFVVAFGQSFFHVDCFKCAKCNNQVTADTNLLLLSDGSPICANCSYNCNVCHQPILDEAIMTGDDSYHAHCFKCKVCNGRIDELIFAKTSHGIYCMNCHNERMAKIRRHAQRKRERERSGVGGAVTPTREPESKDYFKENSLGSNHLSSSSPQSQTLRSSGSTNFRESPSMQSSNSLPMEGPSTPARKRKSLQQVDNTPKSSGGAGGIKPGSSSGLSTPQPLKSSPSTSADVSRSPLTVTVAPPDHDRDGSVFTSAPKPATTPDSAGTLRPEPSRPPPNSTSPKAGMGGSLDPSSAAGPNGSLLRRKSYDDGVRPLDVLLKQSSDKRQPSDRPSTAGPTEALSVPNTNVSERRSAKPGLTLDYGKISRPVTAPGPVNPESIGRSQTLSTGSDNSSLSSPLKSYFSDSRRGSQSSSVYHSPAASPGPTEQQSKIPPEGTRARTLSTDPQSALPHARSGSPLRPKIRPTNTLERVPLRSDSLGNATEVAKVMQPTEDRLSPDEYRNDRAARINGIQSTGISLPPHYMNDRPGLVSPASPSHPTDVPRGVESDTDDSGRNSEGDKPHARGPPALPPKEPKEIEKLPDVLNLMADPKTLTSSGELEDGESSPTVEHQSTSTFIAPALPPIRFSLSNSDFSDFLKSMHGTPYLKQLDETGQDEPGDSSKPDISARSQALKNGKSTTTPTPFKPQHQDRPSTSSSIDATLAFINSEDFDEVPRTPKDLASRGRASSESQSVSPAQQRPRQESNASLMNLTNGSKVTITPGQPPSTTPSPVNASAQLVSRRLREALTDATDRGAPHLKLDKRFVETIMSALDQYQTDLIELRGKYDKTKRASQHYIEGLSVAQREYDREGLARRNAEAEVVRLRVLLSGQAAKLTTLNGEAKKRETRIQLNQELETNLGKLETDLSKLKVERAIALAEVEELVSSKSSSTAVGTGEVPTGQMSRSLTMRLENIKTKYQQDLVPLTQQREALLREVADLKAAKEQFLEETAVLNARNEELAQLSAQYARRIEAARLGSPSIEITRPPLDRPPTRDEFIREKKSTSFDRSRAELSPMASTLNISAPSSVTLVEESEPRIVKVIRPETADSTPMSKAGKVIKWAVSRSKDAALGGDKGKGRREHTFQQTSILRFSKCDHCSEKLWGSQFRCSGCHASVHPRCVHAAQNTCSQQYASRDDPSVQLTSNVPSMFGRELVEQVHSDCRFGERQVPIIVEKCIEAVEEVALDYEGIYRKTGGTSQTKMIQQLFERGDYAFDLRDTDRFNDICSVTSVLKTYFRSLPTPLMTYDFHDAFISSASLRDAEVKAEALTDLISKLPGEHHATLRALMLHLHKVCAHSEVNLMSARNLGVVFGPTLMRGRDPGAEFSDMAGKALLVEWLVDNAPSIF